MTRVNTLTEIWDKYNKNILSENVPGEKSTKFGNKPGKKPVIANDVEKGFKDEKTSGPKNAEGYKEPLDPKTSKKHDELYDSASFSAQKYNKKDKKLEKKIKESINKYMKINTFDALFEQVLGDEAHSDQETQELNALGIETDVEEVDSDDEITVTLDRDMAQALCDVLQAAIGDVDEDADEDEDFDDEEDGEGFDYYSEDEEDDDEDEDTVDEATDLKQVPDSAGHSLTNSGNNKVGKLRAKSKKASGKTKKYEDGEPKELGDKKAHLQSKKNKVALKQGQDFID